MTALHILGGGPSGLAAAHYAQARGLTFTLHEAGGETGGNCRTLRIGACLYDTGAHRLHARDAEATALFRDLLGDELVAVDAPSRIVRRGATFRFPPEPVDLIRNLPLRETARVVRDLLRAMRPEVLRPAPPPENFRDFAVARYGPTLADLFLLGYTHKLWGRDPATLSPAVAGGRLDGLAARAVVGNAFARFREKISRKPHAGRESLTADGAPPSARPRHLDGAFLYPKRGIGSLFQALEARMPIGSVRVDSRVTRLRHDGGRILNVTVNDGEEYAVEHVISTLPLPVFLRALDPPPPADVLARADRVAFRNLILCVFRLGMDRFTDNASLYFPDRETPFTRLYEPRNRSTSMSPPGETCVVLEIPCDPGDETWRSADEDIERRSLEALRGAAKTLGVRLGTVRECTVRRIGHAYPVLETGRDADAAALLDYCRSFSNVRFAGRNALFRYAHIHDMFRQGREAVESL